MIQFIKDAFTELEHVVWPTPNESKNYMIYTVGTIVVLGIFLAIMSMFIRSGLSATRAQFPHENIGEQTVSGETAIEDALDKINIKNVEVTTGSTLPAVNSGSAQ